MSPIIVNLFSAAAISLVITCMVALKSPRAKSIILVLPIPITIALIGSGGRVTTLSILGLALTNIFVWFVYYLYSKRGQNILFADVLAVVLYVLIAFIAVKTIHASFWLLAVSYVIIWSFIVAKLKSMSFTNSKEPIRKSSLPVRSTIILSIAFMLFSLKQYLAAFVVTFPYNTVFAVYENRKNLFVQAALFTRNSLALWAYFVAYYFSSRDAVHWYSYVFAWATFGVFIVAISKLLPLDIRE